MLAILEVPGYWQTSKMMPSACERAVQAASIVQLSSLHLEYLSVQHRVRVTRRPGRTKHVFRDPARWVRNGRVRCPSDVGNLS